MHSYENEPIVVQREVKAVAIPAGVEVTLKLGSVGYITQALGGSFTVYIDGNLFRIAGHEADAIGKTAAKAPEVPPGASEEDIKNIVWQQLKTCYDPEIPGKHCRPGAGLRMRCQQERRTRHAPSTSR